MFAMAPCDGNSAATTAAVIARVMGINLSRTERLLFLFPQRLQVIVFASGGGQMPDVAGLFRRTFVDIILHFVAES